MTMGKPYAKEGPSAEDKALDLFADMMKMSVFSSCRAKTDGKSHGLPRARCNGRKI